MISHERGHTHRNLKGVIVGKLSHTDMRGPSVLSSWDIAAEVLFKNLVCSLCLTIALWVVTRVAARLDFKALEELSPKLRD